MMLSTMLSIEVNKQTYVNGDPATLLPTEFGRW